MERGETESVLRVDRGSGRPPGDRPPPADEETRGHGDRIVRGAEHLVAQYGVEITAIITDTIERWDAEEASRRIELHVGRDLQFIRINGTVVGSLAGLVIYAVAQLFF